MREECVFADGLNDETYTHFVDGIEEQIASPLKCAVLGILANPPFSYTIGLTDRGWPELIMAGVDQRIACTMINDLVTRFAEEGVPEPFTDILRIARDFPVRLQPVSDDQLEQYMHQAIQRQERVGGPRPTGMQIVFPDMYGRYPDDPECDAVTVHGQMLLTDEQKERVQ